ncbi:MAG: hypothetical protein M1813_008583 [Trichoglossum hirsutum]|nr:MAG: hypothetical protein M1813_008583 [Trichoglossum hirsutum]
MAASSTPTESTYHKTLRVQGIPADHDTESAEGFIKRVLELDDRSSEFVRSITFSPYGKDTKVATITYDGTSKYLAGNGDKWEVPIRFTPLRTFTEGEGHRIDIVAVTGLGGHAFGSFKERGGQHMWLRDSLNEISGVRVLVYGYDSGISASGCTQVLKDIAISFRSGLREIRRQGNDNTKPLILLGHSMGGLVIKEALNLMRTSKIDGDKKNYLSTRGILFFGVPHRGMDVSHLLRMAEGQPNLSPSASLSKDHQFLHNLDNAFQSIPHLNDSKIVSFYETNLSNTVKKEGDVWSNTGPLVELAVIPQRMASPLERGK